MDDRAGKVQRIGEVKTVKPDPAPCRGCGVIVEPVGTGQFWTLPPYCDECQDEREQEEVERKAGLAAADREYRWRDFLATIPPRSRDADLDGIVVDAGNQRAVDAVRKFCADPRPGFVYLTGAAGTGKTYLATAALKCLWRGFNERVLYAPYLDLVSALRRDVGAGNEENMVRFRNAEALLVDDLDEPRENHWSETRGLVTLLSARYDWGKVTIITSNLSLGAFGKAHGARMGDRVQEAGMLFELGGGSRRRGIIAPKGEGK